MENKLIEQAIARGEIFLGIELGSTRIKAVLTAKGAQVISQASFNWENKFENGIYTYDMNDAFIGIQSCYSDIASNVKNLYGLTIKQISSIGFSAMMHGYLVFDKNETQLVPFRTWRNTITAEASGILSEKFNFNIPQRWSISHLYQAILNKEEHVQNIDFVTTLAGYIHYKLTGERVIGIGDASGIFPIDEKTKSYNAVMTNQFNKLAYEQGVSINISDILPKVLLAGDFAGGLTVEGAKLIDITGELAAGCKVCPPEGDAGTGMVATNSITKRTGNISAGTSIFAMMVLEKSLKNYYEEIDMVTTPTGSPVAMVHCNTCTSEIDAWVNVFYQFAKQTDKNIDINDIYKRVYFSALNGEADAGGLSVINYFAGEPVAGVENGMPIFLRRPQANFTLENFFKAQIYSSFATVKLGLDILTEKENIQVEKLLGHGGLFKVEGVAQQLMASAFNIPVAVTDCAGEGGSFGMAILAEYQAERAVEQSLEDYLNKCIFNNLDEKICKPISSENQGFKEYFYMYKDTLKVEKEAALVFKL